MVLLDTHVVLSLAVGRAKRIPERVRQRLEIASLRISPAVAQEPSHLHEIGRMGAPGEAVVDHLQRRIGLAVLDGAFAEIAGVAARATWTGDPFDRLIAAHAVVAQAPLVTADTTIREHLDLAVWEDELRRPPS